MINKNLCAAFLAVMLVLGMASFISPVKAQAMPVYIDAGTIFDFPSPSNPASTITIAQGFSCNYIVVNATSMLVNFDSSMVAVGAPYATDTGGVNVTVTPVSGNYSVYFEASSNGNGNGNGGNGNGGGSANIPISAVNVNASSPSAVPPITAIKNWWVNLPQMEQRALIFAGCIIAFIVVIALVYVLRSNLSSSKTPSRGRKSKPKSRKHTSKGKGRK